MLPSLNELTLYGVLIDSGTYERWYRYNNSVYLAVKYPGNSIWKITEEKDYVR